MASMPAACSAPLARSASMWFRNVRIVTSSMGKPPGLHLRAEILDRLDEPVLERHLRFEAKQRPGPRDVGLTNLRIVRRQRLVDQFALRSGHPDDRLGDLLDGHFARVAD